MLNKKVLEGIASGNLLRGSDEREEEDRFECPKCFGSHFGSSGFGTPLTEYWCHDEYERGCGWHGTYEQCFVRTYEKSTLAAELLAAYQRIEELEGK
jgi:hypothetical protein